MVEIPPMEHLETGGDCVGAGLTTIFSVIPGCNSRPPQLDVACLALP